MALMAKQGGEGFDPIETGTHHGVCYGVVDCGVQESTGIYAGKKAHKIIVLWELPEVRIDVEKDGKRASMPRVISKQYTLSLGEKANLFHDLTSWRGRAFTTEELEGFDVFNVLGANCILTIVHTDKNKAKVASVASLMKGMVKKKPENPIMRYDMSADGFKLPDGLYEWIKKTIMQSEDYKAYSHAKGIMGIDTIDEEPMDFNEQDESGNQDDSDIPF